MVSPHQLVYAEPLEPLLAGIDHGDLSDSHHVSGVESRDLGVSLFEQESGDMGLLACL